MSLFAWTVSFFGTLIVIFGLAYSSTLYVRGMRLRSRELAGGDQVVQQLTTPLYFLIPARNEAVVIAATVRALLDECDRSKAIGTVIVIDDHSDDATIACARGIEDPRVVVLERRLPNARTGKGPALNFAFRFVTDLTLARGERADDALIVVMDADGRLSDGALAHVVPMFDDARVGGVQLGVRIVNRSRFVTEIQDYEFWGPSAVAQYGRSAFGSVSLGGNGQFSRLSALLALGGEPWTGSLTEDLDLTVSMHVAGWSTLSSPLAWIDQEGLESIGALVRQRTRWMQGHMMTARRIPELWQSRRTSNAIALETSSYILTPWILTLPWSVLFHLSIYAAVRNAVRLVGDSTAGSGAFIGGSVALLLYTMTFLPVFVGAYLYYRQCGRECTVARALFIAHAHLIFQYVTYAATWNALWRMVRGRDEWQKTARVGPASPQSSHAEGRESARCISDPDQRCPQPV